VETRARRSWHLRECWRGLRCSCCRVSQWLEHIKVERVGFSRLSTARCWMIPTLPTHSVRPSACLIIQSSTSPTSTQTPDTLSPLLSKSVYVSAFCELQLRISYLESGKISWAFLGRSLPLFSQPVTCLTTSIRESVLLSLCSYCPVIVEFRSHPHHRSQTSWPHYAGATSAALASSSAPSGVQTCLFAASGIVWTNAYVPGWWHPSRLWSQLTVPPVFLW